jgi:hypothetical protein
MDNPILRGAKEDAAPSAIISTNLGVMVLQYDLDANKLACGFTVQNTAQLAGDQVIPMIFSPILLSLFRDKLIELSKSKIVI